MKFADLQFRPRGGHWGRHAPGVQAVAEFPNGYSVSIVRGYGTYGADRGLYEGAVIHGARLVYDTPVTNDVVGYMDEAAVEKFLADVEALPPRGAK